MGRKRKGQRKRTKKAFAKRHYKQTIVRKSIIGSGTTKKTIPVGKKHQMIHVVIHY